MATTTTLHFNNTSEAWAFAIEAGAKENTTVLDYGIDNVGPYITISTK